MFLRPPPGGLEVPKVLFLAGDAGWRGFAVDLAETIAASGYSVFGLDTKKYLTGFTNGNKRLTTRQMTGDMRALIEWMSPPGKRLIVVGWSQGAAMAVLAAQGRGGHRRVAGVLTIALPEEAALGWSWKDTLFSLFRKRPHQPHFQVREHLSSVAPVPLYMIYPDDDDFTPPDTERKLYRAAKQPKWLVEIPNADHSFVGARDSFWTALRRGLALVASPDSAHEDSPPGQP